MAKFSLRFSENILKLRKELCEKSYKHGKYHAFKINDPKPRDIHKASVRDRVIHHALYKSLYPYFEGKFIYDSYSCRNKKGMHKAINRFKRLHWKVSKNNTRVVWVLKCDIKKFFASIDHTILKGILRRHVLDEDILWLVSEIIDSFHTEGNKNLGLPLGNITSQLLINIYMTEFDQFMKRKLKVEYYIRYADDFVILDNDKKYLEYLIPQISKFLKEGLHLSLHEDKVFIRKTTSGIDFLGWVHFPYHRVLRTTTKRRIFKRLKNKPSRQSIASYLGLLTHGNTYKLINQIEYMVNIEI